MEITIRKMMKLGELCGDEGVVGEMRGILGGIGLE